MLIRVLFVAFVLLKSTGSGPTRVSASIASYLPEHSNRTIQMQMGAILWIRLSGSWPLRDSKAKKKKRGAQYHEELPYWDRVLGLLESEHDGLAARPVRWWTIHRAVAFHPTTRFLRPALPWSG